MPESSRTSCWIATDGAIGNEKQCQALAHYLGLEAEVFRVVLREPWNALAPHFRQGGRRAITGPLRGRLDGPLPDLLITAGRRATLVSTTVRRLSAGKTFTAHVLDPRIDTRHFDVVISPRHDQTKGDNVLATEGALHDVDDSTLAEARTQWPALGELPQPRIALLVGASNRAYTVDGEDLERLASAIEARMAGGSVLVTTSRRTDEQLATFVQQRFGRHPGMVWTGGETANPYRGFLAWADRIFVTADSVNMVSEACGTGQPVHCQPPGPGNPKFRDFHQRMRERGLVSGLDEDAATPADPLRETMTVAQRVAEMMDLRERTP